MSDKPLVSIITPAYNAERFIADTIKSVLNQTYANWEMLIANDCSRDNTAGIVERYSANDCRIKMINAEKNSGVSAARNLALNKAVGKYVAFIDSDDCWMPDKLEKQIAFMLSKDIVFSFTSYRLIDEKGVSLNRYVYSKPIMKYQDVIKNTLIGCLTVMINIEKAGPLNFPLIPHTEDTMAWAEILKRGFIAYGMPEVLSLYRVSTDSMTAKKMKMAKLQWDTYRDYCKYGVLKSTYYFCCYAVNAITKIKNTGLSI